MNVKEEQICRLCLGATESDFHLIDEITRQMLEVVSLELNLGVTKEPIICKDCTEILIKWYNFKSSCLDTEKLKLSFADDKHGATFDLKYEYNDTFVCLFCSNRSRVRNFVLRTSKNDITIAEYLRALIPKMEFDVTKNPIICTSCRQDLEYYIKFAENCIDVEEKIIKYCRSAGTPFYAQVKLSDVLKFSYAQMHGIKQEEVLEDIEQAHSELDGEFIKAEEAVDIKEVGVNFNETSSEIPPNMSCQSQAEIQLGDAYQVKYKGESRGNVMLSTQGVLDADIFKCEMCTYEAKQKRYLKRHMLIHNIITEVEMYKCSLCTFKTKRNGDLKNHMSIHEAIEVKIYKCSTCTYETNRKTHLKSHTLIHKNVMDVEMFKCSKCTFKTKRKSDLKIHMLIHKNITEVNTFKCSMCTYEAKRKFHLKGHMLIHKDATEVAMHECPACTFKTKRKGDFNRHLIIHKDVTEVEIYKCSTCTYKTKRNFDLKNHMLIHEDAGVEMFNCSTCTFKTKRKGDLNRHMLIHKDVTELEMFKCGTCAFQTKRKQNLKSHIKRHHK